MRIVALTFHDVAAQTNGSTPPVFPAPGAAGRYSDGFYRIIAGELEALLSHLRKLGYHSVSSREFRRWQQHTHTLPERALVLTFDDGYASHLDLVAPLLLRYRFSGTFFVVPALIETQGYLSWQDLRKLAFLGMEIGSHGMSHRPLTGLAPQDIEQELTMSKHRLEEQLGVPIRALAIPRGAWNRQILEATQRAGYEAVWLSHIGTNGRETNPFALRRVVVRQPFSAEHLVSMVEGWQPAFWWAANQQLLIRFLKRALGIYRYEQLKRRLVPNA